MIRRFIFFIRFTLCTNSTNNLPTVGFMIFFIDFTIAGSKPMADSFLVFILVADKFRVALREKLL